jgi:hypothetical protein
LYRQRSITIDEHRAFFIDKWITLDVRISFATSIKDISALTIRSAIDIFRWKRGAEGLIAFTRRVRSFTGYYSFWARTVEEYEGAMRMEYMSPRKRARMNLENVTPSPEKPDRVGPSKASMNPRNLFNEDMTTEESGGILEVYDFQPLPLNTDEDYNESILPFL